MSDKTKIQILVAAIVVAVITLIYQIFHWAEVCKQVQDPHSENAAAGHLSGMNYKGPSQAEIDADDKAFPETRFTPEQLQAAKALRFREDGGSQKNGGGQKNAGSQKNAGQTGSTGKDSGK